MRIQRGGGQGVQTPPGKSQVIWFSIGNKQLDPPWKKLDPPPGTCWTPSETLKNDRFLWNWPFDFCKINWGLKIKKKVVGAFFLTDLDPPPPHLTKIPGSTHGYCGVCISAISVVPCLPCWVLAIANGCRNRITPNNLTLQKNNNGLARGLSDFYVRWF